MIMTMMIMMMKMMKIIIDVTQSIFKLGPPDFAMMMKKMKDLQILHGSRST